MTLKDRLQQDVKTALKAGDKERLRTLRMALAGFKQIEVDERIELDETRSLQLLDKMVKQRREALEQFRQGGREDLAAQEAFEIEVLSEYLPEPLSQEALDRLIDEAIATTGASGMQSMGQVMNHLRPRVQGRADMKAVSAAVRTRLGQG